MTSARRNMFVISLVSYQNPPQTASVTSLPPPVRVLAVLVRPVDATAEDLQRDRACLTEAAQGLQVRDLSELEWLEKPTWRKLLRAISTTEWHVLYLGGDSRPDRDSGETALTLAGDEIQSQLLGASRLTRVLASKPEPPFAWLTPLHDAPAGRRQPLSRIATTLVDRGPPAALVLDYQVSKSAQITFARALLGRLLDALPVDLALARGRSAVFDAGLGPVAWAIPALYTHTPSWQLVRPVRTGVSSRGEVALAHATLLEAMDDGALAPQMALHPLEGERQELMDEVREALGDAEPTLSTLSGSAENQADAVIQVIEQVKKVQERLPTSQAIQVMLLRAGQAAQSLRD
jgi:hypothetical protein